jgi:hypothetical protein
MQMQMRDVPARLAATGILLALWPVVWAIEQWDRTVRAHNWREDW